MTNVAKIMQYWFCSSDLGVAATFPGYPDNYLFIDVETTGVEFGVDLITEVGWAVVRNRQVMDFGGQLLNWGSYLPADMWAFYLARLTAANASMQDKGRPIHITPERLANEGQHPVLALNLYADLLTDTLQSNELLLGHNACFFDQQIIEANLHRFCNGRSVPWHVNSIFDTGLVERAAQLDRLPWLGDTLYTWQARAAAYPYFTKWSLETHCVPKYRLAERYNLDLSRLHQAGYDCAVGCCLFETFRQIGETGTFS
jgi:DNA polymerase III alpha subunit (gram-positive type)